MFMQVLYAVIKGLLEMDGFVVQRSEKPQPVCQQTTADDDCKPAK